jgi:hypothetical protein
MAWTTAATRINHELIRQDDVQSFSADANKNRKK